MNARDLIALLSSNPDASVVVLTPPTFEAGDGAAHPIASAEFEQPFLGTDRFVLILGERP